MFFATMQGTIWHLVHRAFVFFAVFREMRNTLSHYLNLLVFLETSLGCAAYCWPFLVAFRLALVVLAYSAAVRLLIADDGKYLSPVASGP